MFDPSWNSAMHQITVAQQRWRDDVAREYTGDELIAHLRSLGCDEPAALMGEVSIGDRISNDTTGAGYERIA